MNKLADIQHGAASLSNSALGRLLEGAESEERRVSERRRLLHDRIDSMLKRSGESPESQVDLMAALQLEQELSIRRLELHQQIIDLRSEKSRRLTSLREPLTALEEQGETPAAETASAKAFRDEQSGEVLVVSPISPRAPLRY